MVNILLAIILYGFWAIYMFSVPRMLHIMQLEGYKFSDFQNWLIKNWKIAFKSGAKQLLICFGAYLIYTVVNLILVLNRNSLSGAFLSTALSIGELFTIGAFFVSNIIIIDKDKKERKKAKKPLKYTARAKRLVFWNFIFMFLLGMTFINYMPISLAYSILIFTLPINMIISNFLASPTEEAINKFYVTDAKWKLKESKYKKLIRIGITGSYGKTSTKFILATILGERYNVLATPESFNTTMGNVRVIREKLKPEHEVFISEMGARRKNDIAEICEFVRPQIGIITSIGPQHLETFKSIDNIIKTKNELIDGLTMDGVAFYSGDNEHCSKLYKDSKREKYLYSTKNKNADVYAKDIDVYEEGSTFTVVTKNGSFNCTTKLLGEHNVQNIIGCIAIAIYLGLSNEEIIAGVSKIEPVEHRLQIIKNQMNNTIVIDDAFNSNPEGSRMALDVLSKFKNRKIVITPGMVELGKEEYNLNRQFGRYMADVADIAILVGQKRSKPILEGLKDGKFKDMNIFVVSSLDEATKKLSEIGSGSDVVLFENDLPDNYNE